MRPRLVAPVLVVATLVSCSIDVGGDPTDVATALIRELGDELGLELSEIVCPDDIADEDGTTFTCASSTPQGEVTWDGRIEDDEVFVESRNVIRPDAVPTLEAEVAAALADEVGADLPAENFDCGDAAIVLGDDGRIDCVLTVPDGSGVQYDAVVTVTDLDEIVFDVQVADEPR